MKTLSGTDKKTILLVDDEDYLALFLKKLLSSEGYNVVTACDGQEAVNIYKADSNSIDLVLMDITMPIKTGIEAHEEMIQHNRCAPILLMSAYSKESFDGLTHPHFIRKPMQPTELFLYIEEVLKETSLCSANQQLSTGPIS